MNETAINNAIRELEEMTDLLRKISERKITQKQAADKLGITPQAFQTELKNSFSNYIKKRNIITEDLLLKCLEEIETPCERIAKDIFGIAEYEKLVIIDTENQELFLQRMKDILSEREMSIMSLRYGINTDEPMTLRKIGEQFGVEPQRIRQILDKCIKNYVILLTAGFYYQITSVTQRPYSPVRRSRLYPTIWRKLMNVQSKNTPGYSTKKSWLIKLRKFVDNWRI